MIDPQIPLRQRIRSAVAAAFGNEAAQQDAGIHRSAHADYQADVAMALARRLKKSPRDVATAIVEHLPPDELIAAATLSGPGFINLTLQATAIDERLTRMLGDTRLGAPISADPETVVVDYSSPNLAKEMHVGHLRSTVIGDCIVRLLSFQGHHVIRQNHIGDWGTPFGMLIEHLLDQTSVDAEADMEELVAFYKAARARFDQDPGFAERARRRVVSLQAGDPDTLVLWRRLIDLSVRHFTVLYQRLQVTLRPEDVAGESQYNDALPGVVADLQQKGLAVLSEGAICVFPPGFTGREDEPVPLIIRKQDGGYGYATTDLAALRHRIGTLHAKRIIIVVGAPQAQHLAMVFAAGRLAGWVPDDVRLEHVAFGSVLGPDKKMFKTRVGESVSLAALIDEAIERAAKTVAEKAPELPASAQNAIANAVGIGAIKYADLSSERIKDYVFDWNRMLSFEGNTAPYLMYAHARIRSILRKGGVDDRWLSGPVRIETPEERALALQLLDFASTVERAGETLHPHRICLYVYELATAYTAFHENCPVLKVDEPTRTSRLALCQLTARVLAQGLDLLGIMAPEQM
ncbi:MAG TPA: arginine--tRNA ligase [Polyangia bacterium]|jgi:arginyl-tRNA synthetase